MVEGGFAGYRCGVRPPFSALMTLLPPLKYSASQSVPSPLFLVDPQAPACCAFDKVSISESNNGILM